MLENFEFNLIQRFSHNFYQKKEKVKFNEENFQF